MRAAFRRRGVADPKHVSRHAGMHVAGESDDSIVPAKRANNAKPATRSRSCDTRKRKGESTGDTNIDLNRTEIAAEPVEERGSTKGNVLQTTTRRTQCRRSVSSGLQRVRVVARREKDARFTALLHHLTPELLTTSFYELKRSASPGIDGVTWKEYEADLENRVTELHDRVHRGHAEEGELGARCGHPWFFRCD